MLDLHARFSPFFPIGDGLVRLEVVEPSYPLGEDPARAVVVVRLIVFDEHDGRTMIRDIKEQEIYAGHPSLYDDTSRVDEMLHAQQEVLGEVLRGPAEPFEALMPHDLLFTNVLKLVKARSREDFARALRAKSRLGRYLGK
jgi:hypothetical protein